VCQAQAHARPAFAGTRFARALAFPTREKQEAPGLNRTELNLAHCANPVCVSFPTRTPPPAVRLRHSLDWTELCVCRALDFFSRLFFTKLKAGALSRLFFTTQKAT
jgi:hypothetical protein